MGTLGQLVSKGGRGAPVSPADFNQELRKTRFFAYDTDYELCEGLYKGVAEPILREMSALTFTRLTTWTTTDWRHLAGALRCAPNVKILSLQEMGMDDEAATAFFGTLKKDDGLGIFGMALERNWIGTQGAREMAAALKRGAFPKLQAIMMISKSDAEKRYNPCGFSDEGKAAKGEALAELHKRGSKQPML